MDFDQDGFYKKLEKEIARLEKTADKLEGLDRELVFDMVHALELECSRFRTSEKERSEVWEREREDAQSAIIIILNRLEAQVLDLERTHGAESKLEVGSPEEANQLIGQFFFDCQVAEERIRQYGARGVLTKDQIRDLNHQLKGLVHRMIDLSKKSTFLIDAVLETYEVMLVGP